MGNWRLAASSQHALSCTVSCAEFFGKASNHPGDSAPPQPRYGTLQLLAFPNTKITFEKEEISDHWWDSRKYDGAADGDWENCVRSQGAYFEGDWGVNVLCTMLLVSCILFSKCLHFSYYMAGYFLDSPHTSVTKSWQVKIYCSWMTVSLLLNLDAFLPAYFILPSTSECIVYGNIFLIIIHLFFFCVGSLEIRRKAFVTSEMRFEYSCSLTSW